MQLIMQLRIELSPEQSMSFVRLEQPVNYHSVVSPRMRWGYSSASVAALSYGRCF